MFGTQGNKWINAQVNIVSAEAYQLVFEALRGTDYRGDIALDDIKVTYSPCAKAQGIYFVERQSDWHIDQRLYIHSLCIDHSHGRTI